MKIAVFGNKNNTRDLIGHLIGNAFPVNCLVALSPEMSARHEISGLDPGLHEFCAAKGISVFNPSNYKLTSDSDRNFFEAAGFDAGLCLGWQRLIPEHVLRAFKHGVFGWHGSAFEFPNGRGRSPINWSVRLGAARIFHNLFKYGTGADDGPVFETHSISFGPDASISDVLALIRPHILESSIRLLGAIGSGTLQLQPQPQGAFLTFPKLSENDGCLQPAFMSVRQGVDIVRSCSAPFPGAFLMIGNEKALRIWNLAQSAERRGLAAGSLAITADSRLMIGFADGIAEAGIFEILGRDIERGRHYPAG